MSSWAERMHQRAATLGTVVTSCGHSSNVPYPRRIEKVKFGVPINEVCKNQEIPGPLLVLILKLNKEGPYKKDVFRAPGHQGNMKKLIHFLQTGRLVNIDNFSVYTIASVLKKFFRKLPEGIFGTEGEQRLFQIIEMESIDEQRDQVSCVFSSLPLCTQRLIVLLFGTFRCIAQNAERSQTGMTSEALGVSVAPSFFQSCVSDGKQAKMEDVMKFKAEVDVATKIMKFLIDNFGVSNLFGRENYEYYARITGRILKVEEDWIFSFRYPPDTPMSPHHEDRNSASPQSPSGTTSAPREFLPKDELEETNDSDSLKMIHENNLLESYTRLSISLEDNGLFKDSIEVSASTFSLNMTLEELKSVNRSAENTKSLSFLPQVHERQAARLAARSEWFLSPPPTSFFRSDVDVPRFVLRDESFKKKNKAAGIFTPSTDSQPVRRSSSKDKHRLVRRSSSKKNKENGSQSGASNSESNSPSTSAIGELPPGNSRGKPTTEAGDGGSEEHVSSPKRQAIDLGASCAGSSHTGATGDEENQSTIDTNVQTFHAKTYLPRI